VKRWTPRSGGTQAFDLLRPSWSKAALATAAMVAAEEPFSDFESRDCSRNSEGVYRADQQRHQWSRDSNASRYLLPPPPPEEYPVSQFLPMSSENPEYIPEEEDLVQPGFECMFLQPSADLDKAPAMPPVPDAAANMAASGLVQEVCPCGEIYKSNNDFCHRCGRRRLLEASVREVCVCGCVLLPHVLYCQHCDRDRTMQLCACGNVVVPGTGLCQRCGPGCQALGLNAMEFGPLAGARTVDVVPDTPGQASLPVVPPQVPHEEPRPPGDSPPRLITQGIPPQGTDVYQLDIDPVSIRRLRRMMWQDPVEDLVSPVPYPGAQSLAFQTAAPQCQENAQFGPCEGDPRFQWETESFTQLSATGLEAFERDKQSHVSPESLWEHGGEQGVDHMMDPNLPPRANPHPYGELLEVGSEKMGLRTFQSVVHNVTNPKAPVASSSTRAARNVPPPSISLRESVSSVQPMKVASAVMNEPIASRPIGEEAPIAAREAQQENPLKMRMDLLTWRTKFGLATCCLLSCIFVTYCLAFALWFGLKPDIVQGAFGLATQIDRKESILASFFEEARQKAIGGVVMDEANASKGDMVEAMESGSRYRWYHVEVIYLAKEGPAISESNFFKAISYERQLRRLPGWKALCGQEVPAPERLWCDPGDSMVAVAYGMLTGANSSAQQVGALDDIDFNGEGDALIMPIDTFVTFLEDFHADWLQRWLPPRDAETQAFRSMFGFYLPENITDQWKAFTGSELESLLVQQVSDGEESDLQVYYRVDGLPDRELERAMWSDLSWILLAPSGALLGVVVTTRRVILGLTTFLLAIAVPIIGSTAAAASTGQIPAIAVAAFFFVAGCCADLAVSCVVVWEITEPLLARVVYFFLLVPLPMFFSSLVLFMIAAIVETPLVEEFAVNAGIGIIVSVLLAMSLYPPAIYVGDLLQEYSETSERLKQVRQSIDGFHPFELGGEPTWAGTLRLLATGVAKTLLSSFAVRVLTVLSIVVVVVGVAVADYRIAWTTATPELFAEGHRVRMGLQVQTLYGELPSSIERPPGILRRARKCLPDAYDKAACSWYYCEVDNRATKPSEGSCACKYKLNDASARGASARFVGLETVPDAFLGSVFWRWAETELKMELLNSTLTPPSPVRLGALELEDWETGEVSNQAQHGASLPEPDGSVPRWEAARLRALCYCAEAQCKLDRSWHMLGTVALSYERRLYDGRRASDGVLSVANTHVFVVWGLKAPTVGLSELADADLEFDASFAIEDPWAQRSLHAFCEGTDPDLLIASRSCWLIDFKRWLSAHGERYPVQPSRFYSLFTRFAKHAASAHSVPVSPSPSGTSGPNSYKYFWLAGDGTMRGTFAIFAVPALTSDAPEEVEAYMKGWTDYVGERNALASPSAGSAWFVSPLLGEVMQEGGVTDASKVTVMCAFFTIFVATCCLTCSCGLAAAALACLAFSLGSIAFIGLGLGSGAIGVLEIVALGVFLSSIIPHLLRIAQLFALAYDAPGRQPNLRESEVVPAFRARSQSIGYVETPTRYEYLVDNSALKASTVGLSFRRSPSLADIDMISNVADVLPWGTTVHGVRFGNDWVMVDHRFLPVKLQGVPVLLRLEKEKVTPSDSNLVDMDSIFLGQKELWPGCAIAERKNRAAIAIRRGGRIVMAGAIASVVVSVGMFPLQMAALGQVGLAGMCAAVTTPPTALGLFVVLALLGLGPTRARRRAYVELRKSIETGMMGSVFENMGGRRSLQNDGGQSTGIPEPVSAVAALRSSIGKFPTKPEEGPFATGITAARVLGLPFSVALQFIPSQEDSKSQSGGQNSKLDDARIASHMQIATPSQTQSHAAQGRRDLDAAIRELTCGHRDTKLRFDFDSIPVMSANVTSRR